MILEEEAPRLRDLAHRLVASGPKAAHVSASECHEITEGLLDALDALERCQAALAVMTAARNDACIGWETRLCIVETVPGPGHPDRTMIAALRAVGTGVP